MNLCSKLSARWARIYQQPIDRLACIQADLVNMAYKRVMDMVRILYTNTSKCFNEK